VNEDTGRVLGEAVAKISSGLYVPRQARRDALCVLIVAVDHDAEEVDRLLEHVARAQLEQPVFKPIFLITGGHVDALRRLAFQYETLMTESEWTSVDAGVSFATYRRRRIEEMRAVYLPQQIVITSPGATVGPWFPLGHAGGRATMKETV
jgi:hypothetical protein